MEYLDDPVAHRYFFTAEDGFNGAQYGKFDSHMHVAEELSRLTFCVLVTEGGFVSVGWSMTGNPDPEAFNDRVGRILAASRAETHLRRRYNRAAM